LEWFRVEWNQDLYEIRYDFEKLLVAKSPNQVMIFQDYGGNLEQLLPCSDKHPHLKNRTGHENTSRCLQNNQYEFMGQKLPHFSL